MSEIAVLPVSIPRSVTMRKEPLVEKKSIDGIFIVPVFRETHPLLPVFSRELALSPEVYDLCAGIFRTIRINFDDIITQCCARFGDKVVEFPVEVSPSLNTTANRLIRELEAKKKPRLKKVNELLESKIDCLRLALKALIPFFERVSVFSSETTSEDMDVWVKSCVKELYRIDIEGEIPEWGGLNPMVRDYFDTLTFDEGRLERFYKYRSAGFVVVEAPRIGDTVWYSGGTSFLQGIVTAEGIQTGARSSKKKRVHDLFELESEYGREAIFLRRDVDRSSKVLSEKKSR